MRFGKTLGLSLGLIAILTPFLGIAEESNRHRHGDAITIELPSPDLLYRDLLNEKLIVTKAALDVDHSIRKVEEKAKNESIEQYIKSASSLRLSHYVDDFPVAPNESQIFNPIETPAQFKTNDSEGGLHELNDRERPSVSVMNAPSCSDCFTFDVDDDGEAKPLTDGLLITRFLLGLEDEALTLNAVGKEANRAKSTDIRSYLNSVQVELDIDGDDETNASTDGILLVRRLFGFTGNALTSGAVGDRATRSTSVDIDAYISDRLPIANSISVGRDDEDGPEADSGSGTSSAETPDDNVTESTNDGDGSKSTKTIQVDVFYDRVPYCTSARCGQIGLDYEGTVQKPVRFANATVLDAVSREPLADNLRTDSEGRITFSVDPDQVFIVRVFAQSTGDGAATWGLKVVDNGGADEIGSYPVYVLESGEIQANSVIKVITLRAESGWDLGAYTQTRSAAPFAIMDSMVSATLYALSGRKTLQFEPLDIYWSPFNTKASVGTSKFSGGYITILGHADVDTDEFDEAVVIHEWGHYFQSILSRDDSLGGGHGSGELLDMRVAFSEGWANAYSGLASGRNAYIDTSGSKQSGGFEVSLEQEISPDEGGVKGWYSEDSVQYFIYDLFDQSDDDELELPLSVMMIALLDLMPQRASPTSLFSFTEGVIAARPSDKSKIMALINKQNINRGLSDLDAFGSGETNSAAQYTDLDDLDSVILPVFSKIGSNLVSSDICHDVSNPGAQTSFGFGNRLGAFRFAKFEIVQAGSYRVRLITTEKPAEAVADPDFAIFSSGGLIGPQEGLLTAEADLESHILELSKGQYWAWVQDYNNNELTEESGRYCHRLEVLSQ